MFQKMLLVLDGSPGSPAAAEIALELARTYRAAVTALYIVDLGWRNLLGDEWISGEGVRRVFFRYMERELEKKARQVLAETARRGRNRRLQVDTALETGNPYRVLTSTCRELGPFDLVILPNPSGKPAEGAVKINVQKAARELGCPILIGPAL